MTNRREVPGIREYDGPAGGWGALRATAQAIRLQMETIKAPITLLRTNQPDGFDCPGCAWLDVLREQFRVIAAAAVGFRAGGHGPADASARVRPCHGYIAGCRMGRGVRPAIELTTEAPGIAWRRCYSSPALYCCSRRSNSTLFTSRWRSLNDATSDGSSSSRPLSRSTVNACCMPWTAPCSAAFAYSTMP